MPPEDERRRHDDQEGGHRVDELCPDRDLGVFAEDLVSQQQNLVRHREQGCYLRMQPAQAGHH